MKYCVTSFHTIKNALTGKIIRETEREKPRFFDNYEDAKEGFDEWKYKLIEAAMYFDRSYDIKKISENEVHISFNSKPDALIKFPRHTFIKIILKEVD